MKRGHWLQTHTYVVSGAGLNQTHKEWENCYEVTEGSYYLLNDSISFIYGLFGKKATQSKMS